MYRLAILSFHGCPVACPGEKDTGGMNVYVRQMAQELGHRGHQVDVYTRSHDPQDPEIIELGDGARVIHLKAGPYHNEKTSIYKYIPEFLSNLNSVQRRGGASYDLIHSHYWLSGRIGMILAQRWDIPHVTTFHTLAKTKLRARAGEREPRVRVAVEKRIADDADAIIVSTEHEKHDLINLYHSAPYKIHTIPAGVDLGLFRPNNKSVARQMLGISEKRVILYVGRIEPLKGLDILIRAIGLLEDSSHTRLLIVGGQPGQSSELDRLQALANHLGIGDIVTFAGTVDQTQLPNYYNAADIFVLPSYYESFGLAALEAMACGTPVVVSRVGGLKTFVRDGESGYLIPWRCPEPFAQRLDILLANPALRATMGRAARTKAASMSWSVVADHMVEFYTDVMSERWVSAAGA